MTRDLYGSKIHNALKDKKQWGHKQHQDVQISKNLIIAGEAEVGQDMLECSNLRKFHL